MNKDRQIVEALRKLKLECRMCIGEGTTNCSRLETDPDMNCEIACNECDFDVEPFPCPSCSDLPDICWHEWDKENEPEGSNLWLCTCGKYHDSIDGINPDLTLAMEGTKPLLFVWLEKFGLFEKFLNSPWVTPQDLYEGVARRDAVHSFLMQEVAGVE